MKGDSIVNNVSQFAIRLYETYCYNKPKYIYLLLIINVNDIAAHITECYLCATAKPCKSTFFHIQDCLL